MSRAGISALVIFAAFSGACSASDNPDDPFSGNSGGSTSHPGTAGGNGVAGSAVGSGGQVFATGGSGAGGSTSLPNTGGSATSGGSFGAGGFVTGFGGTNESGAGGRSFGTGGRSFGSGGSGGRSFGSGGSGGRSFGSGGSAGSGQSSGGGGGGMSPTWTEIYTKYLTNDAYTSNCNGSACHNPGKQKGYDFTSKANGYTSVKNNTSQFVSELSSGGMPKGKPKMPAADLAVIKAWVAAGALNN